MLNEGHAEQLLGRDMVDRDGDRIGEIGQVFVDDRTGEPTWVTVKTGWFGLSQSFVPLNEVQWNDDHVQAGYDTTTIKDAPRFATDRPLAPEDEDMLYAHYGLSDTAARLPGQRGQATGQFEETGAQVGSVPAGSRGRLRRYEASVDPLAGGTADLRGATVCQRCGAYVAPKLMAEHDAFHATIAPPAGYARHDVDIEPSMVTPASSTR